MYKYLAIAAMAWAAMGIGAAQDTVSITVNGTGSASDADQSFSFHGDATITGLEKAVVSGGGLYSGFANRGGTIFASGYFALLFPSGGSMVGHFALPVGLLIPSAGSYATTQVEFIVTGGTGKYEGAHGSFPSLTATGTSPGNNTSSFQTSGTGTLSLGLRTMSQVAFGGGWYTALYFSSARSTQAGFAVSFFGDNGAPLNVPALGGTFANVSIAPGGSTRLEIPNQGALVQGYATMKLPEGVTGYGVFRQSVSGIQDQEAVVPLSNSASTTASLTFDDTNYITAVALVNPSSLATTVTITARSAAGGALGTATIALAPRNKTAVALRSVPGLAGVAGAQGTVTFTVSTGNVAVLGLRFYGSAFTSIPATEQ